MTWPFNRQREEVDLSESRKVLEQAIARRSRTRRVSIAVDRAIAQNHFTADLETIMEGRK